MPNLGSERRLPGYERRVGKPFALEAELEAKGAEPNGLGKSSLRDQGAVPDPVEVVIDPDRIARELNPADPREADRAAGKVALALFESSLAGRRSLSLETTLAGHSILRRFRVAKAGFGSQLLAFIVEDFPRKRFTLTFHRVLSQPFGMIRR